MIVFIILRSDDAGCLLIRATIDADIANGDVSRSGGTGEGNLVFSPAISDHIVFRFLFERYLEHHGLG
jgi:hypothetical protein